MGGTDTALKLLLPSIRNTRPHFPASHTRVSRPLMSYLLLLSGADSEDLEEDRSVKRPLKLSNEDGHFGL